MIEYFLKKVPKKLDYYNSLLSNSYKDILKLSSGAATSQLIAITTLPIVTRLYGPENFGILGVFISLISVLSIFSTLSLELAVVVPKKKSESLNLVFLVIILSLISCVIYFIIGLIFKENLFTDSGISIVKPFMLYLPVAIFILGIHEAFQALLIKKQQFGFISKIIVQQRLIAVTVNLLFYQFGALGFILGYLISQVLGLLRMIIKSSNDFMNYGKISLNKLTTTFLKYKNFALFTTPACLINSLSKQLPNLIFASYFGPKTFGLLILSEKLLQLPLNLISDPVGKVFQSKAPIKFREGNLFDFITRIVLRLFIYGLIISTILIFVISPLMPLVFGDEWSEIKKILPIMIPIFISTFVVTPLSTTFISIKKNNFGLFSQILQLFTRLTPLLIGLKFFDLSFIQSLTIYSTSFFIGQSFYILIIYFAINKKKFMSFFKADII